MGGHWSHLGAFHNLCLCQERWIVRTKDGSIAVFQLASIGDAQAGWGQSCQPTGDAALYSAWKDFPYSSRQVVSQSFPSFVLYRSWRRRARTTCRLLYRPTLQGTLCENLRREKRGFYRRFLHGFDLYCTHSAGRQRKSMIHVWFQYLQQDFHKD